MRAVIIPHHGDSDVLEFVSDFPVPSPASGEALIKVAATSLNQVDLVVRRGYPGIGIALPHIAGGDIAGEIVGLGEGAEGFKVGDRVVVYPLVSCGKCALCLAGDYNLCLNWKYFGLHLKGGYAEYVAVPAANLLRIPDRVSYESAATLPIAGMTAWHALKTIGNLRPGQTFFIWGGTGGVGTFAVQMAKHLGATVIATGGTDAKVKQLHNLGVDLALNRRTDDVAKLVREAAPDGAELVLNYVGPETFPASFKMLKKGGSMLLCGIITGSETTVSLHQTYLRHLSIKGLYLGTKEELEELLNMVAAGIIKPYISEVLPLEEAHQGQRKLEAGDFFGKIVLKVS